MKWDPYLTAHTRIISKWSKDLTVRPETNVLEETIGGNLLDVGLGKEFLDMTPKAGSPKPKINKWGYITLISSTQQGKLSAERKGSLGTERTCFQTMYPIRSWYPKSKRNSYNSVAENRNQININRTQLLPETKGKQTAETENKGERIWPDIFPKKTYKWPTGIWKGAKCH